MKKWFPKIIIGIVFLFLYLPIIVLIVFSFNDTKLNILFEGFTLDWYQKLPTNTTLLNAFGNTLFVAVTSTIISTIIGTISAIGLHKFDFKGKAFIFRFHLAADTQSTVIFTGLRDQSNGRIEICRISGKQISSITLQNRNHDGITGGIEVSNIIHDGNRI